MKGKTVYSSLRPVRLLCVAGVALALALMPLGLRGVHADPNGNAQYNFVSGGGTATNNLGTGVLDQSLFGTGAPTIGDFQFAISAHCQAQGPVLCTASPTILAPAPTGHIKLTADYSPGVSTTYQGAVTCLQVSGNQASATFVDDNTGQPVEITAVDNSTSAEQGPPSTLYARFLSTPYTCDPFANLDGAGGFVIKGNVVVNMGSLMECEPMTDNTTYMIDSSCNLYVMGPSGWQVVE